jgi:S1-C subfamily serine protease
MSYDSWNDGGVSPGVKLAMAGVFAVGAVALAFSWYTYRHGQTLVKSERDQRVAQVATLQGQLRALRGRDASLTGTVQSLKTKTHDLAPLANRVLKSVFTIYAGNELGSGFAAWTQGDSTYVLTARHVVASSLGGSVTLTRAGGGGWQGDIVAEDAKNDLAVVHLEGHPAGVAPLWQRPVTTPPAVGDPLLLVGSPYGLRGTVTTGIVSRVTTKAIQTDAAANPGNSGGPALDSSGHVVGVLVAGVKASYGSGLNFAVPIARVCEKLRRC